MQEHIVQTTTGAIRGFERDGRIDYLGIPYAESPVARCASSVRCPRPRGRAFLTPKIMAPPRSSITMAG